MESSTGGAQGTTEDESSSSAESSGGGSESTGAEVPPAIDCPDTVETPEASVRSVQCYVLQQGVASVTELMAALPQHLRDSYTLMAESRSLHAANVEHPRVILYGTDARFLFSISTEPSDPRYDVIEMAELQEESGEWAFRAIDFTEPTNVEVGVEGDACGGCHGTPARPIWGRYPDWPGAYGAVENQLEPAEIAVIESARVDPDMLDGRLADLEMPEPFLVEQGLFHLAARDYGYANTAFNFELGVAVADGIATRLATREDWPQVQRDLVHARFCTPQPQAAVRALYAEYGLEDVRDFYLDERVTVEPRPEVSSFDWNQGNTGLSDIVVFRALDALVRDGDPAIIEALVPIEETRSRWIEYLFELRGEARAAYLAGEYDGNGDGEPDGYDYADVDLRPQELVPTVADALCGALDGAGA